MVRSLLLTLYPGTCSPPEYVYHTLTLHPGPAPCINAALTDKGQQTCTFHLCDIYNHGYFVQNTNATPGRTQQLGCLPGYSAAINWDMCWVQYGYKLPSGAEHHGGFKTEEPVVDARGVTHYIKGNALGGC